MENILSYLWRYNILKGCKLYLTNGTRVEVVSQGDDKEGNLIFRNAIVKINGITSEMCVAVAPASPEGCDLFITNEGDSNSFVAHTLRVDISEDVKTLYEKLTSKRDEMPCGEYLKDIPSLFMTDLFSSLAIRRLQNKSERIKVWLNDYNGDWEEVCYISLARSLGFGTNSEPFEKLAKVLPLKFLQKHADSLFQIEAMLFGVAGFLNESDSHADRYHKRLCNEFEFLKRKFSLTSNERSEWRCGGVRPSNFPHQRIAILASLIHSSLPVFAKFTDAKDESALRKIFNIYPSDYWESHYSFSTTTPPLCKTLGKTAIDLLLINSVAPLLYSYSEYIGNNLFANRAIAILESCPKENNAIVRKYTSAGVDCKSALDSQSLLTLHHDFCTPHLCTECKIGYKLLREMVRGEALKQY